MNRFPALAVLAALVFALIGCGGGGVDTTATEGVVIDPLTGLRTYTTNFPLTESPISEGGNWINGATTGIDWGDIWTTPGQTHDHSGPARYADATALLTGSWAPDQMAQGTVYAGSTNNYPEVELRLRSSLSAHQCTGYEISFSLAPNAYMLIVRWNGPLGNYTILQWPSGSQYAVQTGDVVKATIVGNVITAYKNGVQMAQATDSTYATGNPGMGFNEQTNGTYGYTSFTASEIGAANNPPTVVTAAAANPSPVVAGSTTNLSVRGDDDGGAQNLVYTWSATSVPSGGSVSFSPNGSNAAQNAVATFTKAGTYTLAASIADSQGQTVASSVSVTVNQAFSGIVVSPASATVAPSATQLFTAKARDQFGNDLSTQPSMTWSVSGGGTISTGGLFTAGSSTGGPYTVTAASSPQSGTASVTVSAVPPTAIHINSGGGAVSPFSADQLFSGGNTYSTGNAISTAGVANAAPASLYQTERFGNFSYTIGGLSAGAPYTVRLHFAEIYQTAAGARVFNVVINGTQVLTNFDIFAAAGAAYTAVVKDFTANANASGQLVIQYVTVRDNAKSSGIEVFSAGGASNQAPTIDIPAAASPNPVSGSATSLSVRGKDDNPEANLTYTWATTGTAPAPVTFGGNGTNAAKNTTATFTKAGTYGFQVTVQDQGGLTATSSVSVIVSQSLTSIAMSPTSANVAVGGTQQFTATAQDQFGASFTAQPGFAWTASGGGSISSNGLFTAGAVAGGPFVVTATSGTLNATASVTVSSDQAALFRINAGGGALSPFGADQYFTGGNTYSSGNSISTSGVANAAPAAVYQTERFGNATYTFTGLAAGASHTVRLHFAEIFWTSAGSRSFNVSINGATVLSNFDIYAAAGGNNKAIVRDFTALADASGKIAVQFITVRDNAKISAIEILKP